MVCIGLGFQLEVSDGFGVSGSSVLKAALPDILLRAGRIKKLFWPTKRQRTEFGVIVTKASKPLLVLATGLGD